MKSTNNTHAGDVSYATERQDVSKNTDLRVIRTRRALWGTLVKLVAERSIDDITVGEIAKHAMVNRATFYRHYEDKSDLLERGTAEILTELADRIRPADESGDDRTSFDAARRGLLLVLDHVADHADFYRIMFSSESGWRARAGIRDVVSSFLMRKIGSADVDPRRVLVPADVTSQVVASMIVGLVTWWIETSMPVAKEELIEYYLNLTVLGPYRCLGFDAASAPEVGAHAARPSSSEPRRGAGDRSATRPRRR